MAKRPTSASKTSSKRTPSARAKSSASASAGKKAPAKKAAVKKAPRKKAGPGGAVNAVLEGVDFQLDAPASPAAVATKPTSSISDINATRAFAIDVARMLADDRCEDVQVLDVTGLSQVSDFIIIASGTSDRQMRSAGDDAEKVGETHGWKSFRRHDDERTTWIVVDFVDVVVHVFEPNTRAHYDLEMLWADAPRIEWERPDQIKRDRAGLG
jgi:ribosome-associated protein